MPLPDFEITTGLDALQAMAEHKLEVFQRAVITHIDDNNAVLQQRLQEAYSGGVVKQRSGKAARSVESITAHVEGFSVTGEVHAGGGTAPYVRYLEEGTSAHDIVAKGKALAFIMGGQQVFFKRVHHPGTPAYHIVENTFDAMRDQIIADLQSIPAEVL